MENAALAAIRPYLDEGESAVGTRSMSGIWPRPPSATRFRAEAEVVKVHGSESNSRSRRATRPKSIGRGTHQRMVIDLASLTRGWEEEQGVECGRSMVETEPARAPVRPWPRAVEKFHPFSSFTVAVHDFSTAAVRSLSPYGRGMEG